MCQHLTCHDLFPRTIERAYDWLCDAMISGNGYTKAGMVNPAAMSRSCLTVDEIFKRLLQVTTPLMPLHITSQTKLLSASSDWKTERLSACMAVAVDSRLKDGKALCCMSDKCSEL